MGFTSPAETGGVLDVCMFCGGLVPASGRVGWCYVCLSCESGLLV